jgi:hypothetical protein
MRGEMEQRIVCQQVGPEREEAGVLNQLSYLGLGRKETAIATSTDFDGMGWSGILFTFSAVLFYRHRYTPFRLLAMRS